MDPEVLRLYLQTSGSLGGAGRTEDLLMSTLIGYITGGLNPETISGQGGVGGGSSQLMKNYANDPNPVMQQIIQHIQQGTDPYRLSSFVDALSASNPNDVADLGFQTSDLKNLALAMNKEYTGDSGGSSGSSRSKNKQFDFSKAGLSNPLDLYDAFTIPLNQEANSFIANQREAGSKADKEFKTSSQSSRMMARDMESKPGKMYRDYNSKEVANIFDEVMGSGLTPGKGNGNWVGKVSALGQWLDKQDTVTEEQLNKEIKNLRGGVNKYYLKFFDNAVGKAKEKIDTGRATSTAKADVNSPEFWKWRKEVEKARKAAYTSQESKRQEMAVRNSALQTANEAGRTPLADELKTRLAALSLLKKK